MLGMLHCSKVGLNQVGGDNRGKAQGIHVEQEEVVFGVQNLFASLEELINLLFQDPFFPLRTSSVGEDPE
jgi:hypothetical protein